MGSDSTTGLVPDSVAILVSGGEGISYFSASASTLGVRVSERAFSGGGRSFGVNISTKGFMTSNNLSWNRFWEIV